MEANEALAALGWQGQYVMHLALSEADHDGFGLVASTEGGDLVGVWVKQSEYGLHVDVRALGSDGESKELQAVVLDDAVTITAPK